MSAQPTYETQRIDHLGIVAGVWREIALIEQIDARVKVSHRKVSCGQGTQALILMALLMVIGLALLIYSLAEHKLRQMLKEMKATIPDQRRKPTDKPTMRWVFQLFEGLDILLVRQNGQVVLRQLLYLGLVTGILGIVAVAGSFFGFLKALIILVSILTTVWVLLVGFRLYKFGR